MVLANPVHSESQVNLHCFALTPISPHCIHGYRLQEFQLLLERAPQQPWHLAMQR